MSNNAKKNLDEIKLALVCPGVGNQQRGLESFFQDLFNKLKGKVDVKLIKGGGKSSTNELRIPNIKRDSRLLGGKNSILTWGRRYEVEQVSFFFSFALHLLASDYDIIQSSDPYLSIYIQNFKKFFRKKYKTIFTNALPITPKMYTGKFDLVQQVSKYFFEEGLRAGINEKKMTLIPYAVDTEIFKPLNPAQKLSLKRQFGIPLDKFVILSAGSIDYSFKRMEYLINEVSELKNSIYLLIVGQENQEFSKVKELGKKLLSPNIMFFTAKKDDMSMIYNLADLFVLCSLKEGFGLVFIEAMASGLPIVAHHHLNMKWILDDTAKLIDMSQKNILKTSLLNLIKNNNLLNTLADSARKRAVEKFSWDILIPQYLNMYNFLAQY